MVAAATDSFPSDTLSRAGQGQARRVHPADRSRLAQVSLSIGIVGLPNVGKSTLFNALTRANALASNYPFATIEPNVGIVGIPDPRLAVLSGLYDSAPIVPATVRFVDIAGLVRGASQGQGLGNQFLAHIRETDAICQVVRVFSDPDVSHVDGDVSPARDVDTVATELILADLQTLEKAVPRLVKEAKFAKNPERQRMADAAVAAQQLLDGGTTLFAGAAAAGTGHGHKALFVSKNARSTGSGRSCNTARYKTIGSALKAAPPWSAVVVCRGSYHEQVVVKKPVSLIGLHATINEKGVKPTFVVNPPGVGKLTIFAGYSHIDQANPSTPVGIGSTAGGLPLTIQAAPALPDNDAFTTDKILQFFWVGAKYEFAWGLGLTGAYYHVNQNSYVADHAPCVLGGASKVDCAGSFDQVSFLADYNINKHLDVYAGITYGKVENGLASAFPGTPGAKFGFAGTGTSVDTTSIMTGFRIRI